MKSKDKPEKVEETVKPILDTVSSSESLSKEHRCITFESKDGIIWRCSICGKLESEKNRY